MEVAEFIAKNYYHKDTLEETQRIRDLLAYPGIFFEGIPDDGLIFVYLTLSDEGLNILKKATKPEDFKNGFTETLLRHPGHHVYVFRMVTEGKPKLEDLRRLREKVMNKHNALSFSWHDDHRVLLHTYER